MQVKMGFDIGMERTRNSSLIGPGLRMLVLGATGVVGAMAAEKTAVKVPVPTVEPGLEEAVKWKWKVEAGDEGAWGIPIDLPEPVMPPGGVKPGAAGGGR